MKRLNASFRSEKNKSSCDDFSDLGIGIVHFGPGAFHRAHQAVYTHDAITACRDDWRIVGVSLRSTTTVDVLDEQDCVYSLAVRTPDNQLNLRLIKSIAKAMSARRDHDRVIAELVSPQTRIVSMTITEKAYGILREKRTVDPSHEAIAHDLANSDAPTGIIGIIVKSLSLRKKENIPPFTVLCCDNLPHNGDLVRAGVLDFARRVYGSDLAGWIETNGAFPNTMVDRITPAATDEFLDEVSNTLGVLDQGAIETEPFSQWVIENNFVSGHPAWADAGVLFVDNVAPYEQMKLRMLNGAHSLIAYMGFLEGKTFVRDVMANKNMASLVSRHIDAAAKTLMPLRGVDLQEYAAQLVERFQNPNIAHETYQIAMDGSQKLPQRIFQPAVAALNGGGTIEPFAFATALWIAYCRGSNEIQGDYELRDPRESELKAVFQSFTSDVDSICSAFHGLPDLFPEALIVNTKWRSAVSRWLDVILEKGTAEAIRQANS